MGVLDMTFYVLIGLCVLGILACLYILRRNNEVHRVRIELLDRISLAADVDIRRNTQWKWRYDALDAVTYNEMLWQFWRDPVSMYENLDFLDPEVSRGVLFS